MKLLGLTGGMGVGKSTAITVLEEFLGYSPNLVKFAGPLYRIQEFIYDQVSQAYERPSDFVKDRKLLQWLGTEWGRGTIGENVWVDIWKAEASRLLKLNHFVVCDDVRFDNEAELIHSMGGKVLKITSDKVDTRINTTAGFSNHSSESGLNPKLVDLMVDNSGTLVEYRRKLLSAYHELGVYSVYS